MMQPEEIEQSPPPYKGWEAHSAASQKLQLDDDIQLEPVGEQLGDIETPGPIHYPSHATQTAPKFRFNWQNLLFFTINVLLYVGAYSGFTLLKTIDNYEPLCQWRDPERFTPGEWQKHSMKDFVNTMAIGIIVMYMVPAIMMTLSMFSMSISKDARNDIFVISGLIGFFSAIVTFGTLLGTSIDMFGYSPKDANKCFVENSKIWWYAVYSVLPIVELGLPIVALVSVCVFGSLFLVSKALWTFVSGKNWFCCSYE